MDVFETTLKIVENRSVVRESLTSAKNVLEQCNEIIAQLKETLKETHDSYVQNVQTLEANNLLKNAINDSYKTVKELCTKICNYVEEINEKTNAMLQEEASLNDNFSDLSERVGALEIQFINELKSLETLEKGTEEELAQETSEFELEIKKIEAEYSHYEELCEKLMDETEEKRGTLQTLNLEVEIEQDKINAQMRQLEADKQKKKEENLRRFQEIRQSIEENDKKLELETEAVLLLSKKYKDAVKVKDDLLQKHNEVQTYLETLQKKTYETENTLYERQKERTKRTEEMNLEIEAKKKSIKENEALLLICQEEGKKLNDEINEINAKIVKVDEEISLIVIPDDTEKVLLEKLNALISEEHDLTRKSEELANFLLVSEIELRKKQAQLDALKTVPNPEIIELRKQIESLKAESTKNVEAGKEIEEIEQQNRNLQQTVEQHQSTIKEFSVKKIQLEIESEGLRQELKTLNQQWDNVKKEILRLEASKQKKVKLTPMPPPIRQSQQFKWKNPVESDSSLDDDVTMAEFFARKEKKAKR